MDNGSTASKFNITIGIEYSEHLAVDNEGNILVTEENFIWFDNSFHIYNSISKE